MLKQIIFCNIIGILHNIYVYSLTQDKYGPFTLKINKVELCKGPKRNECCNTTAKVKNEKYLSLEMDIIKNVIPNRGKILVMVNGKMVVRLQMKKPCDHLFLKPLFQSLLNVTQECEFQKGHYSLSIDIDSTAQSYYGGMFFYGNLSFKTVLYNEECNFICMEESVTLSPKSTAPKQ